jgi:N-acetylmuramoyl-L-alanine amidase
MRDIKYIVLHCTATPKNTTVQSILNYWKLKLKWNSPGYHHLIKADGEIVDIHPIEKPSNGVQGYNQNSIHISYIGGVDDKGRALDNRTPQQIASQILLLKKYKAMFPKAEIKGHRDFPNVKKWCPSFDVKTWLQSIEL